MTRDCVKSLIALVRLAYPNYYKDYSIDELKSLIRLWELQFEDYDDKIVVDAVNCLISTSKFPPTIADVKETISQYTSNHLDEHEAWNKLRECFRDCRNKEKYDALDENIKAVFTRAEVIDAGMKNSDNIPFIKNKFIADYREQVKKNSEIAKLPAKSRQGLIGSNVKLLKGEMK